MSTDILLYESRSVGTKEKEKETTYRWFQLKGVDRDRSTTVFPTYHLVSYTHHSGTVDSNPTGRVLSGTSVGTGREVSWTVV